MWRLSHTCPQIMFYRSIFFYFRAEDLRRVFAKYGPIRDIYIPLDYYNRTPRGFGYVQYLFKLKLSKFFDFCWTDMGLVTVLHRIVTLYCHFEYFQRLAWLYLLGLKIVFLHIENWPQHTMGSFRSVSLVVSHIFLILNDFTVWQKISESKVNVRSYNTEFLVNSCKLPLSLSKLSLFTLFLVTSKASFVIPTSGTKFQGPSWQDIKNQVQGSLNQGSSSWQAAKFYFLYLFWSSQVAIT